MEVETFLACRAVAQVSGRHTLVDVGITFTAFEVVAFTEVDGIKAGSFVQIRLLGPDGEEVDASPQELVPMNMSYLQVAYALNNWASIAGPYRLQFLVDEEIVRERDILFVEQSNG
jgi:hypothetical protein